MLREVLRQKIQKEKINKGMELRYENSYGVKTSKMAKQAESKD